MKQSPSKTNRPDNINPEAVPVWVHILARYSDIIFNSFEFTYQWDRACKLFERACYARQIPPYRLGIATIAQKLRKLAC